MPLAGYFFCNLLLRYSLNIAGRGLGVKKETYAQLFDSHHKALYRYLYRMSGSREIAEELLQETFCRCMLSLRKEHLANARAWLYKVARHLYIDWHRKRHTESKAMMEYERRKTASSEMGLPEQEFGRKEQWLRIERILLRLPEHYRTIVYLREVDGFSYAELAEMLELSAEQVKVNLHRGRKKFRELAALEEAQQERGG